MQFTLMLDRHGNLVKWLHIGYQSWFCSPVNLNWVSCFGTRGFILPASLIWWNSPRLSFSSPFGKWPILKMLLFGKDTIVESVLKFLFSNKRESFLFWFPKSGDQAAYYYTGWMRSDWSCAIWPFLLSFSSGYCWLHLHSSWHFNWEKLSVSSIITFLNLLF